MMEEALEVHDRPDTIGKLLTPQQLVIAQQRGLVRPQINPAKRAGSWPRHSG
jgi:hypothetical protein